MRAGLVAAAVASVALVALTACATEELETPDQNEAGGDDEGAGAGERGDAEDGDDPPPEAERGADPPGPDHEGGGERDADEEAGGDAGDLDARVDEVLAGMSVAEQVGQLLIADVYGDDAHEVSDTAARGNRERYGVTSPAEVVTRYHLGGVIYFTHASLDAPPDAERSNLHTPAQVAELSRDLQGAAGEAGAGVPLLVGTDQEHGLITRTPEPFTRLPGPMALGAADDVRLAEASGEVAARELAAVGINLTFAPTADVTTEPANPVIGVRSPGGSPDLVARTVTGQLRGLTAGGVGAVAKHFPGHGSVDTDSHAALPVVPDDETTLRETALPPFEAAIDEGVGAVMPGHLVVPALDPERRPATVSPEVIEGVLRRELGFDGVVVTDALNMHAITAQGDPADVALAALDAGVDMLLMPPDLPRVHEGLVAAVDDGRLPQERLEQSVRRVLAWKADLGILDQQPPASLPDADDVVGAPEHDDLARRVAGEAVTAIEAECGALPLAGDTRVAVVGPRSAGALRLADALTDRGVEASAVPTDRSPTQAQLTEAGHAAADADATVQATDAAWRHRGQQRLNDALQDAGGVDVAVSTAEPYDAAHLTAAVHIAAYDTGAAAIDAVADVLTGDATARGRLPVPVGDHDLSGGRALDACR